MRDNPLADIERRINNETKFERFRRKLREKIYRLTLRKNMGKERFNEFNKSYGAKRFEKAEKKKQDKKEKKGIWKKHKGKIVVSTIIVGSFILVKGEQWFTNFTLDHALRKTASSNTNPGANPEIDYMPAAEDIETEYANEYGPDDVLTDETETLSSSAETEFEMPENTASEVENDAFAEEYMEYWAQAFEDLQNKESAVSEEENLQMSDYFYRAADFLFYGQPIIKDDGSALYLSDLSEGAKARIQTIYFTIASKLNKTFPSFEENFKALKEDGGQLYIDLKTDFFTHLEEKMGTANYEKGSFWYNAFVDQCKSDLEEGKNLAGQAKDWIDQKYQEMRENNYNK